MMAANGGGPPPPPPPLFMIKKEGGVDDYDDNTVDDDDQRVGNISNNMKSISIAERRAAKCGFNSANINNAVGPGRTTTGLSSPQGQHSTYVTIPPGISPSALLDSPPILVPNAQAQVSPTTGTFHYQFPLSPNPESLKLKLKLASSEVADTAIFPMDSSSNTHSNITVENLPFEDYFEYPRDFQEMNKNDCNEDALAKTSGQCLGTQQPSNTRNQMFREIKSTTNNNYQEKHHHHQKGGACVTKEVAKHSEDGFYWRKYGQKHVKGSEFPRSYYKCTNANCLVKKKVERSHAGEVTQIVYKGSHNHPIPQPAFKRLNDMPDPMASHKDGGGGGGGSTSINAEGAKDVSFGSDIHNWMPDGCLDRATSAASILSDFSHDALSVSTFDQPIEAQEFSSNNNLGNQDGEDQNQASPESISFKDEDEENGECETKKRKRENFPHETTIPRSARDSKVVVQIESDVDILDDGYRWRKYGQKVVKGNPNPRSYYKCTTPGCPVRKHVERAAEDIKSVLTTYEGKHNHDVPTSKTGSLAISDAANQLSPTVANNTTVSNSSPVANKQDHVSKAGIQVQDLPLYMERKPILNYNDFMRSNLPGNFSGHGLSLGTPSSLYPYSFPPFPSLAYNSLLMNGNNQISTYSTSSKFYPMLTPNYMSLSSQISHVPAAAPNICANFPFNNYATLQNSTRGQDQIQECQTANVMMKPKEEHKVDQSELYDTCMSVPNHGNGSL